MPKAVLAPAAGCDACETSLNPGLQAPSGAAAWALIGPPLRLASAPPPYPLARTSPRRQRPWLPVGGGGGAPA